VEVTLGGIERLLAHLGSVGHPGEHERWAEERLRSRAEWLRRQPRPAAMTVDGNQDVQVVHGDYQDSNLFFENGVVSSIID
jgi:hypothetical protein